MHSAWTHTQFPPRAALQLPLPLQHTALALCLLAGEQPQLAAPLTVLCTAAATASDHHVNERPWNRREARDSQSRVTQDSARNHPQLQSMIPAGTCHARPVLRAGSALQLENQKTAWERSAFGHLNYLNLQSTEISLESRIISVIHIWDNLLVMTIQLSESSQSWV